MAYPTVSAPYGFKPVNLLGGQVFAGSTRQMAVATAHGTSIFYGDVVIMSTNGCITGAVLTASTINVAGVFLGCSYINSQSQRIYAQYLPSGTTGTVDALGGIIAYVADDPDLVMRCAVVSGTTVIAQAARSSLVGGNVALVANVGNTITGDSAQAILNAGAADSACPFKIIDVIPDTSPASGSFVEVLVTWTQGVHMYRGPLGLA